MSTSPSWFDQEKFSRLVKKVGPKNLSEPPAATPAPSPPQPLPPSPPAIQPVPASAKSQPLPPSPSASQPISAPSTGSQPLPPSPSASQPIPAPSTGSQPLPPSPSASQPIRAPASASQRLPEPQNGPETLEGAPPAESLASTARISLVSKPPSLLSEHRALPALPRRSTPLPGLKALFQFPPEGDKPDDKPEDRPSGERLSAPVAEMPSVITQPLPETPAAKQVPSPSEPESTLISPKPIDPVAEDDDDLAGIWQKMALLNEELAQTIQERDHAVSDINLLREQLEQADDLLEKMKGHATPDELVQIARERDAAVAELESLKKKGDSQRVQLPDGISKTKELVFLTQERDQARKEYAELRKQFEMLKRDQTGSIPNVREDSSKFRKELEQQLEGFRIKLEEKNREIAELKAKPATGSLPAIGGGGSEGDEKLKAELGSLRAEAASLKSEVAAIKEQLTKAKEDASIAQRGLALSQKALQETRDTLREATEGTSLSRHNFDNLKTECASLTQQITVLQAQNEQLSRELAAAKLRQSGRLP